MEVVLAALVGAIGSIVLSIIGVFGARKAGLGITQDKLVDNLKDLVDALEKKSKDQELKLNAQDVQIQDLRKEVRDLKQLTIEQADIIRKLLSKRRITINGDAPTDLSR